MNIPTPAQILKMTRTEKQVAFRMFFRQGYSVMQALAMAGL